MQVKVDVGGLNFRTGPNTTHSIIRVVFKGEILDVKGEEGVWLNVIDRHGTEGWLHGGYTKPYEKEHIVIVTARVLNFRIGPGTTHRIIRGLNYGTLLTVKGRHGDWLNVVDNNSMEGWVHSNFVTTHDPSKRINPVEWYIADGWRMTSPYGPRTGRYAGFHRGVDFGGKPCGAPVKTPFGGRIVAAQTSGMGTWGNTVCVELSPDYVTLNAHLQRINVRVGQHVKSGDVIGTNGGTNHSGANYACHIHYEVLNNNGSRPWRGSIWGDPAKFRF